MFFFFKDTATPEIYTLSLHDALPIFGDLEGQPAVDVLSHTERIGSGSGDVVEANGDRKSTRLNSSHQIISYAVFCLKKKISQTAGHGDFRQLSDIPRIPDTPLSYARQ